jgi:hypothetical protein
MTLYQIDAETLRKLGDEMRLLNRLRRRRPNRPPRTNYAGQAGMRGARVPMPATP